MPTEHGDTTSSLRGLAPRHRLPGPRCAGGRSPSHRTLRRPAPSAFASQRRLPGGVDVLLHELDQKSQALRMWQTPNGTEVGAERPVRLASWSEQGLGVWQPRLCLPPSGRVSPSTSVPVASCGVPIGATGDDRANRCGAVRHRSCLRHSADCRYECACCRCQKAP